MKPSLTLTTILLAFSSCTSAWPYPPSLFSDQDVSEVQPYLERRQQGGHNIGGIGVSPVDNSNGGNKNGGNGAPPAKVKPSNKNTITAPPKTDSKPQPTNKPAGSSKKGSKGTTSAPKGKGKTTAKPTTTKLKPVPSDAAQGGLSMVDPPLTSGMQYYRIDETVTFKWNYTSLLRPPPAVDVLATVAAGVTGGANPTTYTLTTNMSYDATQTLKWDSGAFNLRTPLPIASYTLIVYDAAAPAGISQTAGAGHLGVYNGQFVFGMYTNQPAPSLENPYVCVTCNAAGGQMERLTGVFLTGMVALSMGSFLWVGLGNGLW